MLYIFSNSDDKSIHHIVCTDSDIRAGIIISRIYEREHISGEPIRVQFHNETATTASVYGSAKRYEAIKRTDKRNDSFEEEVRAKVAELGKGEPVNIKYSELVNDTIARYRSQRRDISLRDFVNYVNTYGYNRDKLYADVVAEVDRRIVNDLNELEKVDDVLVPTTKSKTVKPNVAPVVPYDNPEEFIYKANINYIVSRYYKNKLNTNSFNVIREVARNNNYDVDKFIEDVVSAHELAHVAYIAKTKKSNTDNNEK